MSTSQIESIPAGQRVSNRHNSGRPLCEHKRNLLQHLVMGPECLSIRQAAKRVRISYSCAKNTIRKLKQATYMNHRTRSLSESSLHGNPLVPLHAHSDYANSQDVSSVLVTEQTPLQELKEQAYEHFEAMSPEGEDPRAKRHGKDDLQQYLNTLIRNSTKNCRRNPADVLKLKWRQDWARLQSNCNFVQLEPGVVHHPQPQRNAMLTLPMPGPLTSKPSLENLCLDELSRTTTSLASLPSPHESITSEAKGMGLLRQLSSSTFCDEENREKIVEREMKLQQMLLNENSLSAHIQALRAELEWAEKLRVCLEK